MKKRTNEKAFSEFCDVEKERRRALGRCSMSSCFSLAKKFNGVVSTGRHLEYMSVFRVTSKSVFARLRTNPRTANQRSEARFRHQSARFRHQSPKHAVRKNVWNAFFIASGSRWLTRSPIRTNRHIEHNSQHRSFSMTTILRALVRTTGHRFLFDSD